MSEDPPPNWRERWARDSAAPAWEGVAIEGIRRTYGGTIEHGPDFATGRDPIEELRQELLDALNYLTAIKDQRDELVALLGRTLASNGLSARLRRDITAVLERERFDGEE